MICRACPAWRPQTLWLLHITRQIFPQWRNVISQKNLGTERGQKTPLTCASDSSPASSCPCSRTAAVWHEVRQRWVLFLSILMNEMWVINLQLARTRRCASCNWQDILQNLDRAIQIVKCWPPASVYLFYLLYIKSEIGGTVPVQRSERNSRNETTLSNCGWWEKTLKRARSQVKNQK